MTWMWMSASIVRVGAELSAAAEQGRPATPPKRLIPGASKEH